MTKNNHPDQAVLREVLDLLKGVRPAINAAYSLKDAEWRDHDASMTKYDNQVREFEDKVRGQISKLKAMLGEGE